MGAPFYATRTQLTDLGKLCRKLVPRELARRFEPGHPRRLSHRRAAALLCEALDVPGGPVEVSQFLSQHPLNQAL